MTIFVNNLFNLFMVNTQTNEALNAKTYFKGVDGESYFCYDHIEGLLATVIMGGSRKGFFTRTDATAAALARQYHRELVNMVSENERVFSELTEHEWKSKLDFVLMDIQRTLSSLV